MVEIGVYSTVGTSWYELPKFHGMSAGKCGKSVVNVCGNGCGTGENYRKDVVKKPSDLALLLRVQSGFTEDKSPHAKIGESAHEGLKNRQNRLMHEPVLFVLLPEH